MPPIADSSRSGAPVLLSAPGLSVVAGALLTVRLPGGRRPVPAAAA